jgi:hypothetical protein
VGDPRTSTHSNVAISSGAHFGIGGWFNPGAFANPAAGGFGDARRNSLIGPGYSNVDLSLAKEFSITERLKVEIRGDAYNAFNHVNYGNPDTPAARWPTLPQGRSPVRPGLTPTCESSSWGLGFRSERNLA